jgi:hypothetical protein
VGIRKDNWLRDWWPQLAACIVLAFSIGGAYHRIAALEKDSDVLKDIRDRVVRIETNMDAIKSGNK